MLNTSTIRRAETLIVIGTPNVPQALYTATNCISEGLVPQSCRRTDLEAQTATPLQTIGLGFRV